MYELEEEGYNGLDFEKLLAEVESERFSPNVRKAEVTWLAEQMVKCYEDDLLCWYMIYGRTGAGKSTYAVMSLVSATRMLGFSTRWEYIDRRVVFSLHDVLNYFQDARSLAGFDGMKKDIGVVVDDAGVHLHSYKAFTDKKLVMALTGLLQVARPFTANLIFTTPSPLLVLRATRIIPDTFFVGVARKTKTSSVAGVYVISYYPPSLFRTRKILTEEFDLKMPYKHLYDNKREEYVENQLDALRALLDPEAYVKCGVGDRGWEEGVQE